MKLLKYVPLFILLITIISLIPQAHATGCGTAICGTKSNSFRVVPPTTLAAGQSIVGSISISWIGGGKSANPTPTVQQFTFQAASSNARQASAPVLGSVTIAAVPDSATVTMTGQVSDNGKTSPFSCSQNVVLKPNVEVTATCASGPNGATFTVGVTNIGEAAPPTS